MLPSQSPRPVLLRTGVGRPKGKRRGPVFKLVVIGGCLIGVWFLIGAILPDRSIADGDAEFAANSDRAAQQQNAQNDGDWRTAARSSQRTQEESPAAPADRSRAANRNNADDATAASRTPETELVMGGINKSIVPTANNEIASAVNDDDDDAPAATASHASTDSSEPAPPSVVDRTPMANTPVSASPAAPATPASRAAAISDTADERTLERVKKGYDLIAANRLVEARLMLSRALASGKLSRSDAELIRKTLTELNDRIVFSPEIFHDDEYTLQYTIASGDSLERIVRRMSLQVDWRFVQRINRISNPRNIRVGDRIKLITGPFHVVVDKNDFTLDLYLGDGENQVYVRTFSVGLGEYNSTPVGLFRVRPNSKLINPEWINPRTRERFASDDPNNPIGNRWIGLEGITEAVRDLSGYGIHGTIEPDSIGTQASMGCVRMLAEDIELVYELLVEGASTVRIQQ